MNLPGRGRVRRYVLQLVHRRLLRLGDIGPVVSFTFDDFPRTAYTVGGTILRDSGARGTYYTAFGLMNSADGLGDQFRLKDLYALVADGHELANHTLNHVSGRTIPVGNFLQEVRQGRSALQQLPNLIVSKNFAYPHGAVTANLKGSVGNEMRSCRGTYHGVNAPVVDLNLLRANPLYGDRDGLGVIRRLLRTTEESRGWLIFYTHDVRNNPSSYGCTPALLESVVKLVREMSMNIRTVDEVVSAAI